MIQFVLGLVLLISSLACTSITAAADVSGQWVLKQDRDFRGNAAMPVDCTLTQQGSELTFKFNQGRAEFKGQVRGRKVSWRYEMTGISPMTEDRLVLTYSGELNASGTKIDGTWRLISSVFDEKGNFVAERHQ
jgi:hypothetical protein